MTGEADYLLRVITPDLAAYQRFLVEHLARVPGIANIKSNLALKQVQYRTSISSPIEDEGHRRAPARASRPPARAAQRTGLGARRSEPASSRKGATLTETYPVVQLSLARLPRQTEESAANVSGSSRDLVDAPDGLRDYRCVRSRSSRRHPRGSRRGRVHGPPRGVRRRPDG